MTWSDTPEGRRAFVDDAERMVETMGGVRALVERGAAAWSHVDNTMHLDPAKMKRADLERAYIDTMHAAWVLARLSWAVNASLLDGGDARRYMAAKGGDGKIAKNPTAKQKAEAKAGALALWKERQAGRHPKLRTVEQFATEVMRRWPVLSSAKVICGWSARWTKEVKGGKNPVC